MNVKVYNKLIRDKIPQIIAQSGKQAVTEVVSGEEYLKLLNTELTRPKSPASICGGCQRAVKSSMDSTNIQRGLNPPLNEVSFNAKLGEELQEYLDSQSVEELADLVEVVYAILDSKKVSLQDFESIRQ